MTRFAAVATICLFALSAYSAEPDWSKHWAFQPVRKAEPPRVRNADWPNGEIDRFILARLEAAGLQPAAAADKRTLIRRLTFDLLGVPPTPDEVEAYVADTSADAYVKLVDRLLASPHYGEKWARHWLDVARYADTKGYVFFEEPQYPWAWTYRDFVIESFNADLPYADFVRRQIAADLLDLNGDRRPLRGLGFLTLGGHFMNNAHDIVDDRIDVVTRGLMGLTVTCARCHDHKFDPIPIKDYYSLYGIFASSEEPPSPPLYEPPPNTEEYRKFAAELAAREGRLKDFVRLKRKELMDGMQRRAGEYLFAAWSIRDQPPTENFMLIADGADLNPKMIARWRAFLDKDRKRKSSGISLWHRIADLAEAEFAPAAPKMLAAAPADANPLLLQVLKEKPLASHKDAAERIGQLLRVAALLRNDSQSPTRGILLGAIGRNKIAAGWQELADVWKYPDNPVNAIVGDYGDLDLLPDRPSQGVVQNLRKAVEEWRMKGPGSPPRAHALQDAAQPFAPRVFLRGNPNTLGAEVPRQFVSFLSREKRTPFVSGSGRRELAEAIVSPDNPLTWRVIVNRVWQHHFGRGLVDTPSDFGLRSDPPSHPELLDYLAARLIEEGGSLKKLHRLILLSSTYRQAAVESEAAIKIDPDNRLLSHANRKRLDWEGTRDHLLAVSGSWDRRIGGASVANAVDGNSPRRTMYAMLDRLNLPELIRTFDFPSPDASSPGRDRNTVPPQALFWMNHRYPAEAGRRILARPDVAAARTPVEKIDKVYLLLFSRLPDEDERRLGEKYLAGGKPESWPRYVHALLQTNEFVFID